MEARLLVIKESRRNKGVGPKTGQRKKKNPESRSRGPLGKKIYIMIDFK